MSNTHDIFAPIRAATRRAHKVRATRGITSPRLKAGDNDPADLLQHLFYLPAHVTWFLTKTIVQDKKIYQYFLVRH